MRISSATATGPHILSALDGMDVTPTVVRLIEKENILGFTLFKRNFSDATSLRGLCQELQARAKKVGRTLILAVDQEGGRVFRLPAPFSQVPPMRVFGDYVRKTNDVAAVFEVGRLLGHEVRAAGFNLDFAPVADVDLHPKNPIIGDRSFAASPLVVSRLARALMCGLLSVGIMGCYKHFPGHGATTQDSHLELPFDERDLSEIVAQDLKPYQDAIALGLLPTLMTAHVVYPRVDAHKPATLSPLFLTEFLRKQMGYQGVVFSDDLLMKAIADNEGVGPAAEEFFCAGGDVALICKNPELTLETLSELSQKRASNPRLDQALHQALPRILTLLRWIDSQPLDKTTFEDTTNRNRFRLNSLLKKIRI